MACVKDKSRIELMPNLPGLHILEASEVAFFTIYQRESRNHKSECVGLGSSTVDCKTIGHNRNVGSEVLTTLSF